jgi:hypothetical protein
VDTEGFVLKAKVHSAKVMDWDGIKTLLWQADTHLSPPQTSMGRRRGSGVGDPESARACVRGKPGHQPVHSILRRRDGRLGWKEGIVGRTTVDANRDAQAGYTLLSDEPVVVEDLRSETRFRGHPLLREHGVVSGMTVIIRPGGLPFGVLGAHTRERRTFTEDDVNFLRAVANVLAAAIERERAEEKQRFLADTGALLSSSLDYRTTLASVARLAVPTLADWCAVDVLEDGSVERLAVEHPDPEKVVLALKLQERYPQDPEASGGV